MEVRSRRREREREREREQRYVDYTAGPFSNYSLGMGIPSTVPVMPLSPLSVAPLSPLSVAHEIDKVLGSSWDLKMDTMLLKDVNKTHNATARYPNPKNPEELWHNLLKIMQVTDEDIDGLKETIAFQISKIQNIQLDPLETVEMMARGVNRAMANFNLELENKKIGLVCSATTNFTVGLAARKYEQARLKEFNVNVDLCTLGNHACIGNLGYARSVMPQLDVTQTRNLVRALKTGKWKKRKPNVWPWSSSHKNGWEETNQRVAVREMQMMPRQMFAVQREINAYKIAGMANSYAQSPTSNFMTETPPVIAKHKVALPTGEVRNVYHILDGHHRMYTLKLVAPERPIPVYVIPAAPDVALGWMRDFMQYGTHNAEYEAM